jgi:hypothetical protein
VFDQRWSSRLFLAAALPGVARRNPLVIAGRYLTLSFLLGSFGLFCLNGLARINPISNAHIIPAKLSI